MNDTELTELKAVFKLETTVSARGIEMGNGTFDKVKTTGGISNFDALSAILRTLEKLGIEPQFTKENEPFNVHTLLQSLKGVGKWGYTIRCADLEFAFARNVGREHAFVHIKEKQVGACKSWDAWIAELSQIDGFAHAWVSNSEYEYWQNAKELSQYQYGGRDASKLPLVSNGFPPPLLRQIVDTSKNPGRTILQTGYIEAVGATMWLSKTFFDLTKGAQNLDEVRKADWLTVTTLNDDVIKVQAHPTPFSDESTAAIQDKTRALLYPLPA